MLGPYPLIPQEAIGVIFVMVITQEAQLDLIGCRLTAVLACLALKPRCC